MAPSDLPVAADEWRAVDHGPNVAMGHAYVEARFVRNQLDRVLAPLNPAPTEDAKQAINAIHKVRRAAGMALAHLTTTTADSQLREALEDFDRAHPHVSDARNVLEHFDEYARGVGDLQQPAATPRSAREPDEELVRLFRVRFDWIDNDPTRPRLQVGPYEFNLIDVTCRTSGLPYEIWAAIMVEEGNPVSHETIAALTQ